MIVRLALRRPYTFVVMAILILVMGVISIVRTPTDIFPNISNHISNHIRNPSDHGRPVAASFVRSGQPQAHQPPHRQLGLALPTPDHAWQFR